MEKTTRGLGAKTALIVTGGYCNVETVRRMLPEEVDLTIAADSGYARNELYRLAVLAEKNQ